MAGTEHTHWNVVAVRTVPFRGHQHVSVVKLDSGSQWDADQVIKAIERGDVFTMVPPEGSPAYYAYLRTGLPLLIQVGTCPDCTERVLRA